MHTLNSHMFSLIEHFHEVPECPYLSEEFLQLTSHCRFAISALHEQLARKVNTSSSWPWVTKRQCAARHGLPDLYQPQPDMKSRHYSAISYLLQSVPSGRAFLHLSVRQRLPTWSSLYTWWGVCTGLQLAWCRGHSQSNRYNAVVKGFKGDWGDKMLQFEPLSFFLSFVGRRLTNEPQLRGRIEFHFSMLCNEIKCCVFGITHHVMGVLVPPLHPHLSPSFFGFSYLLCHKLVLAFLMKRH